MIYKIVLILSLLFLSGCSFIKESFLYPDEFYLNTIPNRPGMYIFAEKLTNIDSVDHTFDNGFVMFSGGKVALSSDQNTDFIADFTVDISKGEGVKFHFRTTKHELAYEPEISFVYSTIGSYLQENGKVTQVFDTVKASVGIPERVIITNWGRKYTIQVGCKIIYYGTSLLPTTEFIITETLPSSQVLLTGVDFITLYRANEYNTPKSRSEREVW